MLELKLKFCNDERVKVQSETSDWTAPVIRPNTNQIVGSVSTLADVHLDLRNIQ